MLLRTFALSVVFAMLLAACGSGEEPTPTVVPVPTFTPTPGGEAQPPAEAATSEPTIAPTSTPAPIPTRSPMVLSGNGQAASEMFELAAGLAIAHSTHNGSRHFGVTLLDGNGDHVELLANDTGVFDGSKAAGIRKAGPYLLTISADGPWTVSASQ